MRKAGILSRYEILSAEDANDALDSLNLMLSSWSLKSLNIFVRMWEPFTLSAGVASYTIGTGQMFNTRRPVQIISAYVRHAGTDSPVAIISDTKYGDISQKNTQGIPESLYYQSGYPYGKIFLHYVPNTSDTLYLLTEKKFQDYGLDDAVELPDGWEWAIVHNLAVALAAEYSVPVSLELKELAADGLSAIQTANARNRNMDYPNNAHSGNINTGYWA